MMVSHIENLFNRLQAGERLYVTPNELDALQPLFERQPKKLEVVGAVFKSQGRECPWDSFKPGRDVA